MHHGRVQEKQSQLGNAELLLSLLLWTFFSLSPPPTCRNRRWVSWGAELQGWPQVAGSSASTGAREGTRTSAACPREGQGQGLPPALHGVCGAKSIAGASQQELGCPCRRETLRVLPAPLPTQKVSYGFSTWRLLQLLIAIIVRLLLTPYQEVASEQDLSGCCSSSCSSTDGGGRRQGPACKVAESALRLPNLAPLFLSEMACAYGRGPAAG